jgi:hypothetical protein
MRTTKGDVGQEENAAAVKKSAVRQRDDVNHGEFSPHLAEKWRNRRKD